jgi:mannose-6-phosphate isomerase-like protein (cupin superfamily)
MKPGAVVRETDAPAELGAGGTCTRTLLDTGPGLAGLTRRLADIPAGAQLDGTASAAGELWYVIAGTGVLRIDGHPEIPLGADQGAWVPAGARYRLQAGGQAGLRLDTVALPGRASDPAAGSEPDAVPGAPVIRALSDCDVETTGDREFRVVFGPGRDCPVATQFVGHIPPGRAPDHSHPYDEIVLIMQGEGTAHIGGAGYPLSQGTYLHLPPGLVHCLENTGTGLMRVLGVFHPADSPAAKL